MGKESDCSDNKKINVLFTMLCRDFHEKVVEKFKKGMEIGYMLAVTEMYIGDLSDFDATFEMGDCFRGLYYKYSQYEESPPVDDLLIEKMYPYDMDVLKMMDRIQGWRWNFEKRMQVYYEHIRFWNYILDKFSITHIVFMNVPHEAFDYVIYRLAKIRGVKTIVFTMPMIFPGRAIVCDDFSKDVEFFGDFCNNHHYDGMSETPLYYYDKYAETKKINGRVNKSLAAKTASTMHEVCDYLAYMEIRNCVEKNYKSQIVSSEYAKRMNNHFTGIVKRVIKLYNILKTKRILGYYESLTESMIIGEPYVYFPLHYQPEATSSPGAGGVYSNQLISIKILASSLPQGYKVYVKEHPSQAYIGRNKEFYDQLRGIKNVRLISVKVDSEELLDGAVATASLTGSIAVESVVRGINCILFGISYYNKMEGVIHVRTYDDCRRGIMRIISGECSINQNEVKRFFQCMYDYSEAMDIGYFGYGNEEENVDSIVNLIVRGINSRK